MTFTEILNLSISASWLVLAVAAVRFLLKKAPKALHCALWALVAFRLLCPVTFESELSLVPSREVIPQSYLAMEPAQSDASAVLDVVTNPVYQTDVEYDTEAPVDRLQTWDVYATIVWWTGMGAMAVYALYSYLSLRLRVRMAAWSEGNVWECDELDSPFILGILRPRIYLPSGLDPETKEHVLAHENAHLKRLDHLWKPLGFALLTVHWFNPVMWLGYILLCHDIELACDEGVIKKLDKSAICRYSQALVACAVDHKMLAACPLAFGEVGVKGRIKSMLNYKKPGFWVIVTAVVLSIAVAVCFMTVPKQETFTLERILSGEDCHILHIQEEQYFSIHIPKDALPDDVANGFEHAFEPGAVPVAEYGNVLLFLRSARMSGDELLLEIHIDQTIGEEGIVLLTQHPFEDDPEKDANVAHGEVFDARGAYANAAIRRGLGDEHFSVGIKLDVWNQTQEYVEFDMTGIWCLFYTFGEPPEPTFPAEETSVIITPYAPFLPDSTDCPTFSLLSDGTFTMTTSVLSSYMGFGTYSQEGDTLTLVTDDGLNTWRFTADGDGYRYDRANSSPIRYYPDLKEAAQLGDGTLFLRQEASILTDHELDEAIRSVILQENRTGLSEDKICVTAYRILDQQELCIDSSDGGSNLLTLYLYTVYREFVAEGTTLLDDGGNYTPAVLTFDVTDGSYVLTEYWTPTEGVSYSKFTETARNLLTENELEYRQSLEDQCVRQAEEWLADNLPADAEIGQLLDEICSYPLWSSAPGPYINTHPSEYERILELKTDTLRYCFEQFVQGEQMGLRGHIMAIVCQEIITASGEECLIEDYPTGQAWFNLFAEQAYGHLVQMSREDFEKNHPACAVALGYLGI